MSAKNDVIVTKSGGCNGGYQWWVAENRNRDKSIDANIEISQSSNGKVDTYERQFLLPPGGTQQVICSGSHGSSAGGAYTATAKLAGAEYK